MHGQKTVTLGRNLLSFQGSLGSEQVRLKAEFATVLWKLKNESFFHFWACWKVDKKGKGSLIIKYYVKANQITHFSLYLLAGSNISYLQREALPKWLYVNEPPFQWNRMHLSRGVCY